MRLRTLTQPVYFDHDNANPNYIRLLSASLYNSWYNLKKKNGAISSLPDGNGSSSVIPLAAGNYTIDFLAEEFNMKNIKSNLKLIAKTNTQIGSMVINNPDNLRFSVNLVELLGVNHLLAQITTIKRLNSPTTYFIHCDLVDKDQNLLNGKAPTVLARFEIRGKPFEKVNYQTTQQHVLCDASSCNYANSITLSVRDENNNLFDFNEMPLEFEVEIN